MWSFYLVDIGLEPQILVDNNDPLDTRRSPYHLQQTHMSILLCSLSMAIQLHEELLLNCCLRNNILHHIYLLDE